MRLCCGLMDGQMWDAVLQPAPDQGPGGNPVVVLSNDEVLSPADAEWGEFTIVEANEEERTTLKGLGYSMADWDPIEELGCGSCHADVLGNQELSQDTSKPDA